MKTISSLILLTILLASCAPVVVPASATATLTPAQPATLTPFPTATPAPTPTPVTYIEGLDHIPIPDSAFIDEIVSGNYLRVMGLTREQVTLVYIKQGVFVVMLDQTTDTPLAVYVDGAWQNISLKFLGKQAGISIGSDTVGDPTPEDIAIIADRNFVMMSDFSEWRRTEPQPGQIELDQTAQMVIYKDRLNKLGITEYYASAAIYQMFWPDWLMTGDYSQQQLREFMQRRIQYMIDNNSDASALEVVNEPYLEGNPEHMQDIFYKKWGNSYDYISEAFQMARDYSRANRKNIRLFFNENDNHYPIGLTSQNSRKIVSMLKQKGLIDFVGMQMHVGEWRKGAFDELMVPGIQVELDFYQKLGVPVEFTEVTYKPSDEELKLSEDVFNVRLAHVYEMILKIALERNITSIVFWGVSDRHFPETGNFHLFDVNGQPRLAYYTVLKTLFEAIK
ncbi:MAG: endo-1,4-beta-xylanase [Chloroflexota bacterium]